MSVKVIGNGGVIAEVDVNRNLNVTLPQVAAQAGMAKILDSEGNTISTTENGFLKTSSANVVFFDQVDGSSVNTNMYDPRILNMTITQSGGYWNLNAGASLTAGAYAIMQTVKCIPVFGMLPLIADITAKYSNLPESNATAELGIGTVATTSAPTDFAGFRWSPSGVFQAVLNNGGTEQTVTLTAPTANTAHIYEIEIVDDHVIFNIDDTDVADIFRATGQAFSLNAGRQQVIARVYNGGSAPSLAPQLSVGEVTVIQEDMNQAKSYPETLGSLGRGFFQNPITFAQTSNHTNSMTVTATTLSNTTCANTSLGGKFALTAPASGATDYLVFAWQNDTGYQKTIYGIAVSTAVIGAAIVTATILEWSLGVNSSAVSLATADTGFSSGVPQVWGDRHVDLGVQGFVALAGIGTVAGDLVRQFPSGIIIESGRYLKLIVTVPSGAATGSLLYRVTATILGGNAE